MKRLRALILISPLLTASIAIAGISITQSDGSTLQLPDTSSRIISLAPNLTELVFAAGAGKQLLATVEYSNYPQAARQLPRVGDAFRFDLEKIVSLKPDLVLAWASGNPELALQKLESFGLKVWRTEAREPEDIAGLLEAIGRVSGQTETANAAANAHAGPVFLPGGCATAVYRQRAAPDQPQSGNLCRREPVCRARLAGATGFFRGGADR
jgi:iron complex transport system substrate-binding protein